MACRPGPWGAPRARCAYARGGDRWPIGGRCARAGLLVGLRGAASGWSAAFSARMRAARARSRLGPRVVRIPCNETHSMRS